MPLAVPRHRLLACIDVAGAPALGRTEAEVAPHILDALRHPLGSPPLAEVVRPGERVVIVANDQTRVARTELFLPALLDELNRAGVEDGSITCLFALGAHRQLRDDEMAGLVGPAAASRIRLANHNCRDEANLVSIGVTSRGHPVRINRRLVEADRIVLTGSIVHHFFAGFGGGPKALVPGCAAWSTIQHNHAMMLDPAATIGRLDGNPVHADLLEAAQMADPDFLLNVVLNEDGDIAGIFAGDMVQAHRRGCELVDRLYRVPLARPADLVVASCGGYPKDINVYQAQKAMDNAVAAVRRGGVVILLAQCPEGAGDAKYLEWMRRYRTPAAIAEATRTGFELGGHKAYAVTRLLERAEIILVSDMKPDEASELRLTPAGSLDQALDIAADRLGPEPSVVVMPRAGLALPQPEWASPGRLDTGPPVLAS